MPKSAEKCGNPHFLRIVCAPFAQKARFSAPFGTVWHSFWNRRKPHFFVQINVFAVWPLRLDRKYTTTISQEETTSLFSKRAVFANVPSFRFLCRCSFFLYLASRKCCDFENAETLRFFRTPKFVCDFGCDFLAMFLQQNFLSSKSGTKKQPSWISRRHLGSLG